ncbi:twin-arginine translocase TatA/TatE family subunit [uncultured Phascolarctobacterium sp.]|uniref:twin-arginine translocase TatA/TatE family subunit n=1 Tax=Phascolarctobacterium sp. TaxID=2049039 RepID=UPI0025FD1ED1|nr:twin-arginine translocase TatA/TatE family subunit [uncultured Phascolarctobacterium sp.]
MFGLGLPELLLILVIGLIFFGPGKLPDIGAALGKSMREFKQAVNGVEAEAKKAEQEITVAVAADTAVTAVAPEVSEK